MSMTVAETPEAPLSPHWQSYIATDGIPVPGSFHPTYAHLRVIHIYRAA
jgi:hypothetical protein